MFLPRILLSRLAEVSSLNRDYAGKIIVRLHFSGNLKTRLGGEGRHCVNGSVHVEVFSLPSFLYLPSLLSLLSLRLILPLPPSLLHPLLRHVGEFWPFFSHVEHSGLITFFSCPCSPYFCAGSRHSAWPLPIYAYIPCVYVVSFYGMSFGLPPRSESRFRPLGPFDKYDHPVVSHELSPPFPARPPPICPHCLSLFRAPTCTCTSTSGVRILF